jgi:hypothetical protein
MKRFGKAAGILLAACALAMAQDPSTSAARGFRVSKPPEAPAVQAPSPLDDSFLGFDRSEVDIDALERYDDAVKFDRSDEDPAEKAQMWRELAQDLPKFADAAEIGGRRPGEESRRARLRLGAVGAAPEPRPRVQNGEARLVRGVLEGVFRVARSGAGDGEGPDRARPRGPDEGRAAEIGGEGPEVRESADAAAPLARRSSALQSAGKAV